MHQNVKILSLAPTGRQRGLGMEESLSSEEQGCAGDATAEHRACREEEQESSVYEVFSL